MTDLLLAQTALQEEAELEAMTREEVDRVVDAALALALPMLKHHLTKLSR